MGNCISVSISCDSVFSLCQSCITKTAKYQWNLGDNFDALETAFHALIEARDDLMRRVEDAEKNQMKRTNQVQRWLSRVQVVENEVGELLQVKPQETGKLCFGGFCSTNCYSSYKFGKKVARKLQFLTTLKQEGVFEVVAERLGTVVDEIPSESTMVGLQSKFDEVWRCLGDEKVGVIGIYGMGGVGKTTLLTQVNNKFLDTSNGFDIVIWVVASKNLQIGAIQDTIGKKIGLFDDSWKNKELDEKASYIFKFLSKRKFVILLDDIWKRVDLMKIGIPLPTPKNSSKVIFTTRIREVCGEMDADKEFRVECLPYKEAWELFQKKVGDDILNCHPRIRELVEAMCKKCDGLPLALITIGRAMACKKAPEEWEYAIQALRKSDSKYADMEAKVYNLLKFSYDSLPTDKMRSCLLYCSLFSEDYVIEKSNLIDCWIGEGLLDENIGCGAQNEGYHVIGSLLRACLLEGEDDQDYVKMHDMIRDMCLWIAREVEREKHNFLVCTGLQLTEFPESPTLEGVRRLSLMQNQIEKPSVTSLLPYLLTLFVNRNNLKSITSDFFQFMPSLRFLNLSHNRNLSELPLGISNLVSLQHLDVSYTAIRELPKQLKALVNLKCLIMEHTSDLQMIPPTLISSFSELRVLRMKGSHTTRQVTEDSVLFGNSELFIEELLCLKYLNKLTINIKSFRALRRFLESQKLRSCTQSLSLFHFDDTTTLNVLSLAEMIDPKSISILHCQILEELKIDYARGVREKIVFHSLGQVLICRCVKLRDLTWLVFAPNLKRIWVGNSSSMDEIISFEKLGGHPDITDNVNPFPKLEYFTLEALQNLRSVYRNALPFPRLTSIRVRECPKLKKLPLHPHITKQRKFLIEGEESWLKELQWEDEAGKDAFIPCFQIIDP